MGVTLCSWDVTVCNADMRVLRKGAVMGVISEVEEIGEKEEEEGKGFWSRRRKKNRDRSLPALVRQL